ncbi:T9SS type A sorting domain-containing protein [Flavobacterium sp.]|jgi:uncharacterized delta-60 repeat protein|uniref:T9SS type A sorting domain-containing protein n=1 Tax=Flavobacterium sp. TaxID=239 RepID=UPI0022BDA6C9|nr:T9SS type A sorting domain-containing protein [Flavobacterium sp.]MCZ8168308.1 T9SS type A sorting domain-containing protein [Flavobacterium sp.]MCZ8298213.1 T9SS type A sorting domain-containing protein [Flavobacterium sp.]
MKKIIFLVVVCYSSFTFSQLVLDPTYGNAGVNDTGLPSGNVYGSGISGVSNAHYFYADNKVLIPYSLNPNFSIQSPNLAPTIGVRKYLENGSLDASFGTNGIALFTSNNHAERFDVSGITVQSDGKILLVGRSHNLGGFNTDYRVFICRLNANGTKDTSFGTNGVRILNTYVENSADLNDERLTDVWVDSQGRITAVGYNYWFLGGTNYDGSGLAIRFTANGAVDTTFGVNGIFESPLTGTDSFSDIYEAENGNLLLLGNVIPSSTSSNLTVMKITSNGTLNTAFGTNGISQLAFGGKTYPARIFPQSNGSLMVSGLNVTGGLAFAKLDANGILDTSFSGDGINLTNIAVPNHFTIGAENYPGISSDLIKQMPNGDYILCMTVRQSNSYNYIIAQLNENTTLDTAFMSNGYLLNDVTAWDWARFAHLQSDNKLVVMVSAILYRYQDYIALTSPEVQTVLPVMYPNPTKASLDLGQTYDEVILFDALGKQVFSRNQVETLDLSSLEAGVYYVQVALPTGERVTRKVIKE